jgi:hypothetical protein
MPQEPAAQPGESGPVSGQPGLRWTIKLPFLHYIFGMADGRYSVTDGAEVLDNQVFRYSLAEDSTFDTGTGTGMLKFHGDVRFSGHHGFLFVRVADPWLEVDAETATLSVAALPGEEPSRFPLVTLDLRPAGSRRYRGENVRLTEPGSELFGEAYPAGEPFDDLTVLC